MTSCIARLCIIALLVSLGAAPTTAQTEIGLTAPAGALGFGAAVDIKSTYAVVGAPQSAGGRGTAYVYRNDAVSGWTLDGTLLAPGGISGDAFGTTVAIGSNARVAVGAPAAGPNNRDGTIYVFRRDGPGAWTVEQTFTSRDMGRTLAFDENVLAATDFLSGAVRVRVWRRAGTTWSQVCIQPDAVYPPPEMKEFSLDLPYVAYRWVDRDGRSVARLIEVHDTSCSPRPFPSIAGRVEGVSLDEGRLAFLLSSTSVILYPDLLLPSNEVVHVRTEGSWGPGPVTAFRGDHLVLGGRLGSRDDLSVLRANPTDPHQWSVFSKPYWYFELRDVALSNRFVLVGATNRAFLLDLTTLPFQDQLAPPVPYAPAADSTDAPLPLTFVWGAVDGAQSYRLEVDNDSLFRSPQHAEAGLIDTTFVIGSQLPDGGTSYWRVRGERVGPPSPWSPTSRFTRGYRRVPATPVLTSPAQNAQNVATTVTLRWQAATRAARYQVQLATEPTFVAPVLDTETTALSQVASGLATEGQVYYWRVRAWNSVGFSDWSTVRSFATRPAAPVVPVLVSPATGATGVETSPLFVWSRPSQVATYTLQASNSSTFSPLVVNVTVSDTTFQVTTPLQANRLFYWRVRAQNGAGTSAWSSPFSFSTGTALAKDDGLPTEFALSEPQPNPSGGTVTFRIDVPEASPVRLTVFDALGREVAVLLDSEVAAGTHPLSFDASAMPAGVYVARMTAGAFVQTRRLTVAR